MAGHLVRSYLAMTAKKDDARPAHRPRGDTPARPTIYISVTLEERLEIEQAASSKGLRSVSTWARMVLLEAARKANR